jgi:hypothetical protein
VDDGFSCNDRSPTHHCNKCTGRRHIIADTSLQPYCVNSLVERNLLASTHCSVQPKGTPTHQCKHYPLPLVGRRNIIATVMRLCLDRPPTGRRHIIATVLRELLGRKESSGLHPLFGATKRNADTSMQALPVASGRSPKHHSNRNASMP